MNWTGSWTRSRPSKDGFYFFPLQEWFILKYSLCSMPNLCDGASFSVASRLGCLLQKDYFEDNPP
jgi:hypothetical protein